MSTSPSFFDRLNSWARRSITLKLIIIGLMILFLMIPALMLDGLISDRQRLRDAAQEEVASKWGMEQMVGGPVISVPYSYDKLSADGKTSTSNSGYAHFLPNVIDVQGQLNPEERYRGIFVVVLYNTKLQIRGNFDGFNAAALNLPENSLQWENALFSIGISDMTGVQSAIDLRFGDVPLSLGPGTVTNEIFQSGASVPVAITGQEQEIDFSFALDLNGSSALYFRPFGKRTTVTMTGGWANPSFDGGFLPQSREITANGFTANWEILQLNRNYPQQGTGSFVPSSSTGYSNSGVLGLINSYNYVDPSDGYITSGDLFGLRLLLPVDEYKKTYRSTNFAILFIFITFLTFFFIEVLNKRRVHPIQYLLIGAAIILFYVLLLSISEHLLFDAAYWISCVAIVSLITMYSWFILRNLKLTLMVAVILFILYVFFYSLLQLQDYALLVGSLGLLLILGAIMWLTRNIDWYALNRS
ncbi:cell envelope integrity protein CreD [Neolewinella persica]|uniref:cell envelope integrity protein CreD n=1 Tax=Neolewinella persica TaxID=70998 RepID=UPI000365B356|nr:cell envelope integrity protein CreD [Neolewinella persica]